MKVLAIRGKNLASLAGEFGIDFQQEPLASAGLYAIAGPTGSGKSTLLDALCLALYERTPRLSKATTKGESVPDVGDNSVAPSDPRTLLRRGTGEGYAEVDFIGSDGVAYRARWSVRRARSKADGKLQSSEMTLLRIADWAALGEHTKTATLARIEACIGLTFDQFTRAVLLAQNDFATFLKAPDDERAELLQTLTGTEAFTDISKLAFARMKAENDALGRLRQQLQDQQPLLADARAAAEHKARQQRLVVQQCRSDKASIEGHLRWYQQLSQRQAEHADARLQWQLATTANQAAAERHAWLALWEQVQVVQPTWHERSRLQQALALYAQQETVATAALAHARERAVAAEAAYADAAQHVSAAEIMRTQAQPQIATARALDLALARLEPDYAEAVTAHFLAQQQADAAQAAEADNTAQHAAALATHSASQEWLDRHAALQALAQGWPRWESLLLQAHGIRARKVRLDADGTARMQQSLATAADLTAAHESDQRAAAQVVQAEQVLAEITAACHVQDPAQWVEEKQRQTARRDRLQALSLHMVQRQHAQAQGKQLRDQHAAQRASHATHGTVLAECAQILPGLEGAEKAADQALQSATLAASEGAQTLRGQLQDAHPCPVCGALEHPYASHSPVIDKVLVSLQANLAQQRAALRAVQDRAASAAAKQAAALAALTDISAAQSQLRADEATLQTAWEALLAGTALHAEILAVAATEQAEWLQRALRETEVRLAHIAEQEAAQHIRLGQKDAAQRALDTCVQAAKEARALQTDLQSRVAQMATALDAIQVQQMECAEQLAAVCNQLDAAFPDAQWRSDWAAAADIFLTRCQAQVREWLEQQHISVDSQHRITSLTLQRDALVRAVAQADQHRAALRLRREALETTLQTQRQQRAALFEGQALSAVEAALTSAIQAANAVRDAALQAQQQAQADRARWQEALRQAAAQHAQCVAAQAEVNAHLASWLAAFNASQRAPSDAVPLTIADLQAFLEIAPEALLPERTALQALQSAVVAAQAVVDTRSASLSAHAASKATDQSEAELATALTQATQALAEAEHLQSVVQLTLARDDERLQASAALRAQIDQQSAVARVWSQLGELIGSADGKKFRNFAQQLTLDVLLGYGNHHLQSLTRRYRVERIKDSLGLLVVDHDMGAEVRSVHSLSGGESFLVSLAMALGLASLSSHRVRVESLFIDEGFGSLDADALRIAMDALDTLQSQGRKVGVISHVQEMTERIGTRVQVQRGAGGQSRMVVV